MIEQGLRDRRILVTGVTGFLGQAVLERVLSHLPDTQVLVLVRPRRSASGADRMRQLLGQPVFSAWRDRAGEGAVDQALERITVIEGDLAAGPPELPADVDAVLHCAATVSFDPPIDEGFRTNLQGTVNLYDAVRRSGGHPHLVHVSTAYVAGIRKGVVPEASLTHDVDWRTELASALAARKEVEAASRRPHLLQRLMDESGREHAKAGPQTIAMHAERRRRELVEERLVKHGSLRAQTLGWPDVYTLTKALGERAAEEFAGDAGLTLSIVRPSIVESALQHPYPGWIDGFKMAEPIILAYGRGALPDFPGIPDGIVDLIPVDYVASALLAVAAQPPGSGGEPSYYHVSSGARNPLTFRGLYQNVREYFHAHPLPEPGRGDIKVPDWDFPGKVRLDRMLRVGERAIDLADSTVERLPAVSRTRDWLSRIHRERRKVEFMRRYSDLYGPYTETEVIYTDDRALELHSLLPAAEQERFGFDAATIDWRHYLQDVHCPSVTAAFRNPGGRTRRRGGAPDLGDAGRVAVFDLEGTILSSNVIESYVWLRLADLPTSAWPSELLAVARALPRYLSLDRRDRGAFLRSFYRRYEGASVEVLRELVNDQVAELILQRASPSAIRRIRAHRQSGHRTVLITGALDLFVDPLRPLFDTVVASQLATENGRLTGFLAEPPLVGEARAAWLRHRARAEALELPDAWAYGDSHSDLPLLEAVGNPVAVNPDAGLYRVAKRRRWSIEEWNDANGTPRLALPSQPLVRARGRGGAK